MGRPVGLRLAFGRWEVGQWAEPRTSRSSSTADASEPSALERFVLLPPALRSLRLAAVSGGQASAHASVRRPGGRGRKPLAAGARST